MKTLDLLCIGGAAVDLVLTTPRLPVSGEKLVVENSSLVPGGLVANTACAAARLGLRTAWSGLLGDDENGRLLLKSFAEFEVETGSASVRSGQASDYTVILLEPGAERTILIVPSFREDPPLHPHLEQHIRQARYLYTTPRPLAWFREIAALAAANQTEIVLDLEGSSALQGQELLDVLALAQLVFCSRDGLGLVSQHPDPALAAQPLLDLGVKQVVVTLGSQGSLAHTSQGTYFCPAYRVRAVDTTGSGDCFHAAFLSGLAQNRDIVSSLRFASAAAAISVQHFGARGGLPTLLEVERFIDGQAGNV